MPWKIISLVGARQKLVEAVWARHHSIPALARRFGVSRKTVYKWLNRFRRQGAAGLGDRSRRPGAWPHRWAAIWVRRILHWRRHRPHWGAKNGALGLSRLSVWWLRLGSGVEFTRRARPSDNAGHEQFHGC